MNSDFPALKNRLGCIFQEKFRYRCSFDPMGSSSTPPPSPQPTRDPTVSKNPSETLFEKILILMFLWPRGVNQYTSALPSAHTRPCCIEKPLETLFEKIQIPMFLWPRGVIQYTSALPSAHTRPYCIEKPFRNTFRENSDTDVLLTWHKQTNFFFFHRTLLSVEGTWTSHQPNPSKS